MKPWYLLYNPPLPTSRALWGSLWDKGLFGNFILIKVYYCFKWHWLTNKNDRQEHNEGPKVPSDAQQSIRSRIQPVKKYYRKIGLKVIWVCVSICGCLKMILLLVWPNTCLTRVMEAIWWWLVMIEVFLVFAFVWTRRCHLSEGESSRDEWCERLAGDQTRQLASLNTKLLDWNIFDSRKWKKNDIEDERDAVSEGMCLLYQER